MKYKSVKVEIARQAGVMGYCVFVDGLWDADILPQQYSSDALTLAREVYPQSSARVLIESDSNDSGQNLYTYAANMPVDREQS